MTLRRRVALSLVGWLAVQVLVATSALAEEAVAWATHSVTSKDGTRVVYHVAGSGRPLLIVHGGWSNAELYEPLGELLAREYRAVLVERRNYGVSGTGPRPHDFLRDGEDLHAVIEAVGGSVYLFGHSGGGLAALHAVLVGTHGIEKLALYEPPILAGGPSAGDVLARYERFLKDGNPSAAIRVGLKDLIGYSAAETERLAPIYEASLGPAQLAGAVHDAEGLLGMRPDASAWSKLALPVLLIVGERSNEHPLLDSSRALQRAIPRATSVILAGQAHGATAAAPDVVASELRRFFGR